MDATELPDLVIIGDAALMQPQPEVPRAELLSADFQAKLDVLRQCMTAYRGIGIAAPQVGWAARVFCLGIEGAAERYPGAEVIPFAFWINPSVEPVGEETNWAWEGCLSVPGMRGWVNRPAAVRARGLDRHGIEQEVVLTGFAARVFQHEYDHLDGILYPHRVTESRWLLPEVAVAGQATWPGEWPSPGARITGPGELSLDA